MRQSAVEAIILTLFILAHTIPCLKIRRFSPLHDCSIKCKTARAESRFHMDGNTFQDVSAIKNVTPSADGSENIVSGQYSPNLSGSAVKEAIFAELREMRKLTAAQSKKPAYLILSNKALSAIVERQPQTDEQLLSLPGIGPKTLKYSRLILPIVKKYSNRFIETGERDSMNPWWDPFEKDTSKKKSKKMGKKNVHILPEDLLDSLKSDKISLSSLSEEQLAAAKMALSGRNMFITGSAGTGKSHLLKYVIQELVDLYGEKAVAVTAPTGIAAVQLSGQTLHSFAGIGIGPSSTGDWERILAKVSKTADAVSRWVSAKVFIIDEISMVDMDLFELLDYIARNVRQVNSPFGGLQIIVLGDFFQLPPASGKKTSGFCFQSKLWNALGFGPDGQNSFVLKNVLRQRDSSFVHILNEVRRGFISRESLETLNACSVSAKGRPTDDIVPTKLYCTNVDVNNDNSNLLGTLQSAQQICEAFDGWTSPPSTPSVMKYLEGQMDKVIPRNISMKVGAQVMLLRNKASYDPKKQGKTLVNGSRGVVIRFTVVSGIIDSPTPGANRKSFVVPVVRFDNGQVVAVKPVEWTVKGSNGEGTLVRYQIPLKLAWAVTIHKSQGMTLSRAEILVQNAFDFGQVYVALSRVTSLDGLWLTEPITKDKIRSHPKVLEFYNALEKAADH